MENEAIILIDLWKVESGITVKANIRFNYPMEDNIRFYIADGFIIDEIICGNTPVDYISSIERLEFRAPTKKIEIKPHGINELFLSYHGKVDSWNTLYEEDILAINFYTAWYPTDFSINTKYIVKVHLDDSFCIINGKYNDTEKVWYYQPLDFDVNIIALRNYEIMQSDNVTLYYFGKMNQQAVLPYFENYNKIVEYYTHLYGNSKLNNVITAFLCPKSTDIFCPQITGIAAG